MSLSYLSKLLFANYIVIYHHSIILYDDMLSVRVKQGMRQGGVPFIRSLCDDT